MTKIDELMALADALGGELPTTRNYSVARTKLLRALEAALKPGEPVAYELYAAKFAKGKQLVYKVPESLASYINVRPLYTAPPAQTPPRLTGDRIDGVDATDKFIISELELHIDVLKQVIRDASTPSPRLTEGQIRKVLQEERNRSYEELGIDQTGWLIDESLFGELLGYSRAVETAVRKQAGWE